MTDPKLVQRLFDEACSLKPEERAAWLDENCPEASVRQKVERLLEHFDSPPAALDTPPTNSWLGDLAGDPESIGGYRVVRVLGRGGMGVVYEAEQENPRRRVALKVIRSEFASEQFTTRFRLEAHVLGQLRHPGIAQIYEAGSASVGGREVPFFAMELVEGPDLDEHCATLGRREQIELMARICDAVQHAHQKGVIHRDLKPANIHVVQHKTATSSLSGTSTVVDSIGQPKILDFGIARLTDSDTQVTTFQTNVGQIVGTLGHMSPEQVAGDRDALDTRCDVYALGVLLYRILAGCLPHELGGKQLAEAARIIQEEEPTRVGALDATLRGDLDTIVTKSIEKEPARRYDSAAALADDLRRFLASEPISAHPPSTLYQVRKFTSRNRVLVGGVLATFLALTAGIIGTGVSLASVLDLNDQLNEAITDLSTANSDLEVANDELGKANSELERVNLALEESNTSLEEANSNLFEVAEFQGDQLGGIDVPQMGERLRRQLIEAVPDEDRAELRTRLAEINFVDLSKNTLRENVFERAVASIDEQFVEQPVVQAYLLQTVANTTRKLGLLEFSAGPQERALALRREHLAEDNDVILRSLEGQGIVLRELGRYEEAERVFREGIARSSGIHGDEHQETLQFMSQLAVVVEMRGQLDEAEQRYEELVELHRRVLGNEHQQTLAAVASSAVLLKKRGQFEKALPLLLEVHEGRRTAFGPDHQATLHTKESLGKLYSDLRRHEEALQTLTEVLKVRRRTQGEEHPETLATVRSLASLYMDLGRFSEAAALQREVLAASRKMLGDDHPDTLLTINNLAATLDSVGRYEEAEDLYRESLDGHRRVLGEKHPLTLSALGNMGFILSAQGMSEEAEPYYREALEGFREAYGNNHPRTLTAIGNMAVLLLGLGRVEEAEPLYRESLERREKLLGPDHPSTLNAVYNMGNMLIRVEKYEEAEPFCVRALEGYRGVLGDEHIGTLYSLANLGELRQLQGRLEEASELYREAFEARLRIYGYAHPETSNVLGFLVSSLVDEKRFAEAEELLLTAADPVNLSNRSGVIDPEREAKAIRRLVRLYDEWSAAEPDAGHEAQSMEWKQRQGDSASEE